MQVYKASKKELLKLKEKVKSLTGMKITDIEEIFACNNDFIDFGYYSTNYDRVTHKITGKRIYLLTGNLENITG